MEAQYAVQRSSYGTGGGGTMEMTRQPSPNSQQHPHQHQPQQQQQHSDNDHSSCELRALDCNLTSLCDHIQLEGFNNGSFSDVIVHAMGSTYHLHRLILSRSSYFRNMLHGPWKEANAPILNLHVDDNNVNGEAITLSLAYLYGHHPKLNDDNAFRVLAAASFLDLQDLCAICTDFIISELWTSNFLAYQVFAESQDYGIHGERVRTACWGYLCQGGALELKESAYQGNELRSRWWLGASSMSFVFSQARELLIVNNLKLKIIGLYLLSPESVLPKLSPQTLHALLTSDELWVPSEEKRFELALYILHEKAAFCKGEHPEQGGSSSDMGRMTQSGSNVKGKNLVAGNNHMVASEVGVGRLSLKDELDGRDTAHTILVDLANCAVDSQTEVIDSKQPVQQASCSQFDTEPRYACNMEHGSSSKSSYTSEIRSSCSYAEMPVAGRASILGADTVAMEGPSEEGSCYQLNNNSWLGGDQRHCSTINTSCSDLMSNEWGRCGMPLSWGGRIVGRREVKTCAKVIFGVNEDDYDAFVNIFEGGSLLYCNMSFEALLSVRKQLEEMGFPCKSVNDGLWLQMLLSQRVHEIGADTCKNCCLVSMLCQCRQQYGFPRGVTSSGYYMQEHEQNAASRGIGNVYVTDSSQGEGNGFRPVRVHVRGPIDGLAGLGHGSTFVPAAAWPPTRFVFSRVPFNVGNRNCQQPLGNDDPENRGDHNGDLAGDGLTALVGLSQGASNSGEQNERGYEVDMQSRLVGACTSSSAIPMQMLDSSEDPVGIEWDNSSNSISLDMKTPLSHFPPFRFSVEFQEVHRLCDGQVKHSPEVFYAGSLWKVSVQAFSDEDPQGRRTLGLFLHRRKAEVTDSLRKVHMYVDLREKVTARYQLIFPSKREVLVFGNIKQSGTLLPKAPKGWGWRTALLFDELGELLQNGALRIAAVVQLI